MKERLRDMNGRRKRFNRQMYEDLRGTNKEETMTENSSDVLAVRNPQIQEKQKSPAG